MAAHRAERILDLCQGERHRGPNGSVLEARPEERNALMQTIKLAARYTRYVLTSLAAVAFGMTTN